MTGTVRVRAVQSARTLLARRCAGIRSLYARATGLFRQGAKDVLIVNEANAQVRYVYLDMPHSKKPKPSWYGESVGHYEGNDTLMIDTIGISERTFVDNYLTPHTDQLHVVERFTLGSDGRTLNVTVIVDDPGVFTTRWSARQVYHLESQGPWDESPLPVATNPDF